MTPPLPTEPQEMHSWRFDDNAVLIWRDNVAADENIDFIEYLIERCRRAEDRLKLVTESELQAMFEKSVGIANCSKLANGEYMLDWTHIKWLGFLSAARLFGKVAQ